MSTPSQALILSASHAPLVPAIIADAGNNAPRRFIEFFTAEIPNDNTRAAYFKAVSRFLTWCDGYQLALQKIEPVHLAAYIKQHPGSDPTKKQHLAAIRALFDYLVIGQVLPHNPAASQPSPSGWAGRRPRRTRGCHARPTAPWRWPKWRRSRP